jgi:membrane protease YdiL (CAAX protease family)
MKSQIQNLTPAQEFMALTFIFFAFPIFTSTRGLYYRLVHNHLLTLTDLSAASLLIFEVLALAAAAFILSLRGYSTAWLQIDFNFRSSAYGLWLVLKFYLAAIVLFTLPLILISVFVYDLTHLFKPPVMRVDLTKLSILAIVLINPVFEEVALIGYLFPAIEKVKNTQSAFYITLAVRLSCHTYQGVGLLAIGIFGYILGKAYIEKRNLWPLILCHAAVDLIGLVSNSILIGR